mgnify:FL=1
MMGKNLLEIKHDDVVVAFIDEQGAFTCLDKEKMLVALRSSVVHMENIVTTLKSLGLMPPVGEKP